MKTSSTALLATMAAASTSAAWAATLRTSTSGEKRDGSERRLSGKSGKSAKALGLATYEDYRWFEGDYTVVEPQTVVTLNNGETDINEPNLEGRLEIKNMLDDDGSPTLKFEGAIYFTWVIPEGPQAIGREVFDGVASYNTEFANQVTLYSDHVELQQPDGSWNTLPNSAASDVGHLTCSKLANVPSGRSIVCDAYSNDSFTVNVPGIGEVPVHFENIVSAVWTDVTDASS